MRSRPHDDRPTTPRREGASETNRESRLLLGLAASMAVLAAWLFLRASSVASRAELAPDTAAAAPGVEAVDDDELSAPAPLRHPSPDAEAAAPSAPRRTALSSAGPAGLTEAFDGAVPPTRQSAGLKFRVVDPVTREDLADLQVAAFSLERGWRGSTQSPTFKRLTAGEWTLRVRRDGYDSAELSGIQLRLGETTDLGDIVLPRGTGQVFGSVGPYDDGDVRLTLSGRTDFPCGTHGVDKDLDCETCIHPQRSSSRIIPAAGGTFAFDALVEGKYWLEAKGSKGESVHLERLAVAKGEAVRHDIRWDRRTVQLRVTGPTEGASAGGFTGKWTEGPALYMAPVTFHFFKGDRACAAGSFTPSGLGEYEKAQRLARENASQGDPDARTENRFAKLKGTARADTEPLEYDETGQVSLLVRVADRWDTWVESDLVDAEFVNDFEVSERSPDRSGDHPLDKSPEDGAPSDRHQAWPLRTNSPPVSTARRVQAVHRGGGLYEVERVPVAADFVFIRSGPYHGVASLDLGASSSTTWRVDLSARCSIPSAEAVRGQKCVDCHPGMPVFNIVW